MVIGRLCDKSGPVSWASMICMLAISATFMLRAQESDVTTCNSSVIDKNHPPQYIEFDGIDTSIPKGEKKPNVWLRLRNNTSCAIELAMYGIYTRIVEGKAAQHVLDGEKIPIHCYNQTRNVVGWTEKLESTQGYRTDHFGMARLLPGQSLVFSVPGSNFKEAYFVAVPFAYGWEGPGRVDRRSPQHWVVYGADELPRDAREKLSIRIQRPIAQD